MPSPFPGMDPYLEAPAFWSDFHDSFIAYWRDALNESLPEDYEARVNERTHLVDLDAETEELPRPDVAVHREGPNPRGAWGDAVATLEPMTNTLLHLDWERETFIEILRRPDRTVVAALELLSPSNKASDRTSYLEKRDALLRQEVHVVELDLLRSGRRLPLRRPLPPGDYYMLTSRADRRPACEVYAWGVRDRLPTLPIPLRAPDPDLPIDLAALFATAYQRGRYRLPYGESPAGPFAGDDLAWAADRAKTAAR